MLGALCPSNYTRRPHVPATCSAEKTTPGELRTIVLYDNPSMLRIKRLATVVRALLLFLEGPTSHGPQRFSGDFSLTIEHVGLHLKNHRRASYALLGTCLTGHLFSTSINVLPCPCVSSCHTFCHLIGFLQVWDNGTKNKPTETAKSLKSRNPLPHIRVISQTQVSYRGIST